MVYIFMLGKVGTGAGIVVSSGYDGWGVIFGVIGVCGLVFG